MHSVHRTPALWLRAPIPVARSTLYFRRDGHMPLDLRRPEIPDLRMGDHEIHLRNHDCPLPALFAYARSLTEANRTPSHRTLMVKSYLLDAFGAKVSWNRCVGAGFPTICAAMWFFPSLLSLLGHITPGLGARPTLNRFRQFPRPCPA